MGHIDKLLRSYNPNNRIVYIYCSGITGLTEKVNAFDLHIERYIGEIYEMRHMFDNCSELLDFCGSLMSIEQMRRNINFDHEMNAQKEAVSYVKKCIEKDIDGIESAILESLGATAEEGIYLWGAGKYGMALARYLDDRNIKIRGIIDNKKVNEVCDGFPIQSPDHILNGAKIFIAVKDKEANDSIEKQIAMMNVSAYSKRFQDLLL